MRIFNEDEYQYADLEEERYLDHFLGDDANKFTSISRKRSELERRIAENSYELEKRIKFSLALQKKIEEAEVRNHYKDFQLQHERTLK